MNQNKYFHPWHNYKFFTLICRQSFKDKNALLKNDYKLVTNIWILYIVGIFDHLLLSITRQKFFPLCFDIPKLIGRDSFCNSDMC